MYQKSKDQVVFHSAKTASRKTFYLGQKTYCLAVGYSRTQRRYRIPASLSDVLGDEDTNVEILFFVSQDLTL